MAELRVAAARGLVAASVDGPEDIAAVVHALGNRGVRQEDEDTRLIAAREGRRARVTTAKHLGREEELVALAQTAARDHSATMPSDESGPRSTDPISI